MAMLEGDYFYRTRTSILSRTVFMVQKSVLFLFLLFTDFIMLNEFKILSWWFIARMIAYHRFLSIK